MIGFPCYSNSALSSLTATHKAQQRKPHAVKYPPENWVLTSLWGVYADAALNTLDGAKVWGSDLERMSGLGFERCHFFCTG